MSVDVVAVIRAAAWLLDPWHFAVAFAALVLAVALDVVAVVVIVRRMWRAVEAALRSPRLCALTVAAVVHANTPPPSWATRARPVAADHRITLRPCAPKPIPLVQAPLAQAQAPQAAPALPAATRVLIRRVGTAPGAARVIRPAAPCPTERRIQIVADNVIAAAIEACRDDAGESR
jgi:hypothetical protein